MRPTIGILALLLAFTPLQARGQVVWDAPALMRPGAPSGLSVFLLDAHPGEGLGALVAWRASPAPTGLGFRVGIAEEIRGDAAVLLGVDLSGRISATRRGNSDPEVIWWTGAGMGIGDEFIASFPLGLVLGWVIDSEGVTFSPHFGGHAVLDVISGPGDDLDLDASVDLGMDLGFSNGIMVRFGAAVGNRDALAFGIRLPT